jgi:hypothetical protein
MSAPVFREKFFNECHGTFKADIGLYSDEVRVMIVHGEEGYPNLEHRIASALAQKLSLAYLGHSVFDDCHRFILDRKAAGFDTVSSRWRHEEIWGPKRDAGPATVQCAVEIFSLTPTQFRLFRVESERALRHDRPKDLSVYPLDKRTHKALSTYNFAMNLRIPSFIGTIFFHKHIVILMRVMARSRGIEGSRRGYLSPLVLYFFTRRYITELAAIRCALGWRA